MPDWSRIEKYPESTVTCRCGEVYRSHAMFDKDLGTCVSRKPCPKCGRNDDSWRVSSDPETMTL